MVHIIVTVPPYAPYIEKVAAHPLVSGLRLNTVMPIKESEGYKGALERLQKACKGKDLWIDLKARQLRVKNYGVPPFTQIELTHKIELDTTTPVTAYFSDGRESAKILAVEGNKLIMQEGPKRVIGPGESLNIRHPSLSIEGFLTDTDEEYIKAAKELGIHTYMLSFVERKEDIDRFYEIDPKASLIAKIESGKGMEYVRSNHDGKTRLMAARGDLFCEVAWPHEIVKATQDIVAADSEAVCASRILSSLSDSLKPSCSDINDIDNLLRQGYQTLMLGDEICMRYESTITALRIIEHIAAYHV